MTAQDRAQPNPAHRLFLESLIPHSCIQLFPSRLGWFSHHQSRAGWCCHGAWMAHKA